PTAFDHLQAGALATFARVSDSDPRMLRYLAERGIRPGVAMRVTDVQPFGGPVFVEVDGKEHALGGELAEKMRVEPAGSAWTAPWKRPSRLRPPARPTAARGVLAD